MHQRILPCIFVLISTSIAAADIITLQLGPPPGDFRADLRGYFEGLARMFNEGHEGISIRVAEDNFDFNVDTASLEDLGDILFLAGPIRYGQRSELGVLAAKGYIADLTDMINSDSFGRSDFFPNTWDLVTIEDRLLGVPLLARSWAVAIDTSLVTPSEVIPYWSDWNDFGRFLQATSADFDGDGKADLTSFVINHSLLHLWECLFLDAGGDPNDPLDFSPQSQQWLTAMNKLQVYWEANQLAFTRYTQSNPARAILDVPVQFVHDDGSDRGAYPTLRKFKAGWELMEAPGAGPLAPMETTVVAIRAGDAARVEAAWTVLQWLTTPERLRGAAMFAQITPVRESAVNSLPNEVTQVFARQLKRMVFSRPQAESSDALLQLRESIESLRSED